MNKNMNKNNNNRIKKAIFLFATYFAVVFTAKASTEDDTKVYPYNETAIYEIDPYTSYSNGLVYIADEDTIRDVIVDSNDIYIVDYRDCKNPNMCICNSYKVTSKEQIYEIIDILLKYEKENPSRWDRTKDSLYNEWIMHNIGYQFGIKKSHAQNADLDNNDEQKYNAPILKKLLK